MGMNNLERADREEHWIGAETLNVCRVVASVKGNAITFQIALMESYDSQFLGTERFTLQPVAVSGQVKEAGVEDLRIVAPAVIVGFHDRHTIARLDTTEGVRMDFNSERITLTRIDVEQSKTVNSLAKPSHFAINGTRVLVDRATGTGNRVTYLATEPRQQEPAVILNSIFHDDGNIEPHQCWSTGLPVDNCSVPDGGIHLLNRGMMEKQQKIMVQKLLADCIQLTFHHEQRELPVYVMTVGNDGPTMTKNPNGPTDPSDFFFRGLGDFTVHNLTMADFATWFQNSVTDKQVLDHTGLNDRYDFTLRWTPDDRQFVQFRGTSPLPQPGNNIHPASPSHFRNSSASNLNLPKPPTASSSSTMSKNRPHFCVS